MKIIEKKLVDLIEYENNPRRNDGAVQAVAASIKEFGFKVPLVIDSDGVIIAGHTRKKAAEYLGLEVVPCIVADDLTPEQIKAFRIADNKTNDLSEWDFDKLANELKELDSLLDMTDFGFGDFEIARLTEDMEPEEYDEELMDAYTQDEENLLKVKRVIITYQGEEEEAFLKELLGVENVKVQYKAAELMNESCSD